MYKKFELNRTKIKGAISCLNKMWSGILALFGFSEVSQLIFDRGLHEQRGQANGFLLL